jgi:hypothetical protein
VLAGGLGASPLDLNVTEYGVRILLRAIELAVRRVQLLVQVEQLNPRFWSVRLGDMPTPAEFLHAMEERWRFFEWVSQKILPDHCMEKSPYIDIEGGLVEM